VIFDTSASDEWLEELDAQGHITDFFIVTPDAKTFNKLRQEVDDVLGPMITEDLEKRPLSEGFASNLVYFKLDFLDKDRVALSRAFREILPLLWLKAGGVGPRPELPAAEAYPAVFAPEHANFAVLLDEGSSTKLIKRLRARSDLSYVFIVTDADESFKAISADVQVSLGESNGALKVVQLYRDYLINFMINKRLDSAAVVASGEQE
jgi:adenine-specific DNA-methyltransferase